MSRKKRGDKFVLTLDKRGWLAYQYRRPVAGIKPSEATMFKRTCAGLLVKYPDNELNTNKHGCDYYSAINISNFIL